MAAPPRARSDRRSTATALRGRAALYARQSITREGSASLDVQVEACREAAARLKLDLNRQGEVDCVVAYKTDRLSRGGGPGWAPLVDAFEEAGRDPSSRTHYRDLVLRESAATPRQARPR